MTKIDIISGFLGAGKTTLIKKLLKEALPESIFIIDTAESGREGLDIVVKRKPDLILLDWNFPAN